MQVKKGELALQLNKVYCNDIIYLGGYYESKDQRLVSVSILFNRRIIH